MNHKDASTLEDHGVNPSAQRVAIARYVLHTEDHPSADEVWTRVRRRLPQVSRATVYNTLNLFVDKGLVRRYVLTEGRLVFDPHVKDHHHFVDEETGRVYDVPWDAVEVSNIHEIEGIEVRDYQVVLRGRKSLDEEGV